MEILPFNQTNNFVFVSALGAAHWKSNQSWDSWRSSTWTISTSRHATSIICYRRNKVSKHILRGSCVCTGKPVAKIIFLQVVLFGLPETFNSLAIDGGRKQIHLSHAIFEHVQSFHSLFAQHARISPSQSSRDTRGSRHWLIVCP